MSSPNKIALNLISALSANVQKPQNFWQNENCSCLCFSTIYTSRCLSPIARNLELSLYYSWYVFGFLAIKSYWIFSKKKKTEVWPMERRTTFQGLSDVPFQLRWREQKCTLWNQHLHQTVHCTILPNTGTFSSWVTVWFLTGSLCWLVDSPPQSKVPLFLLFPLTAHVTNTPCIRQQPNEHYLPPCPIVESVLNLNNHEYLNFCANISFSVYMGDIEGVSREFSDRSPHKFYFSQWLKFRWETRQSDIHFSSPTLESVYWQVARCQQWPRWLDHHRGQVVKIVDKYPDKYTLWALSFTEGMRQTQEKHCPGPEPMTDTKYHVHTSQRMPPLWFKHHVGLHLCGRWTFLLYVYFRKCALHGYKFLHHNLKRLRDIVVIQAGVRAD